jgi:hypothetical protein
VTLGFGKSPAVDKAEAASRGREVRIIDEAMVSGRSGSWSAESGMAVWGSLEEDGEEVMVAGLRGWLGVMLWFCVRWGGATRTRFRRGCGFVLR